MKTIKKVAFGAILFFTLSANLSVLAHAETKEMSYLNGNTVLNEGDVLHNDTGAPVYLMYTSDVGAFANYDALYFAENEDDYYADLLQLMEDGDNYTLGTPTSPHVCFNLSITRVYGKRPSPSPEPSPVSPEPQHVQHAEKAQLLPLKNSDGSYKLNAFGVPVIVCSECGQVHEDFAAAQESWLDEVVNAVKTHKNFGTDWKTTEEASENPVTITSTTFISFDKDMLTYLNSQPDAVILKFKYQGKYYVTTIPSDFDCLSLADENGWAGFAYIMSICGGREISEEEFKM